MIEALILPGVPAPLFWVCTSLAIVILGISKSGISGAAILAVPLMMLVMPVDKVAATLLPLLVLCDFNAIYHHRRNAVWAHVRAIYFPALIGIAAGSVVWWMAGRADVDGFSVPIKRFVGVVAILFAVYIFARERSLHWAARHTGGRIAAIVAGIAAGFTTTIAHAAGPIVALFLFSQGMGRMLFVGTMAWTFTLLNLTKLPFYAAVGMFDLEVLAFDVVLIPLIPVGSYLGKWMLDRISESVFNNVVMVLALLAGIQLAFNIPVVEPVLNGIVRPAG